jgi:hypothetical protein
MGSNTTGTIGRFLDGIDQTGWPEHLTNLLFIESLYVIFRRCFHKNSIFYCWVMPDTVKKWSESEVNPDNTQPYRGPLGFDLPTP